MLLLQSTRRQLMRRRRRWLPQCRRQQTCRARWEPTHKDRKRQDSHLQSLTSRSVHLRTDSHTMMCRAVLCCTQVHQLQQQLQAAANQAAAGAHQLAAMLPSDKHQQLLKSAKAAAAAEAQQQAQAEHVAEVRSADVSGSDHDLFDLTADSGVGWCCCMFLGNQKA